VEQLDNPSLRGKPVAVGGSENRGGCSSELWGRRFGVAMSGFIAKNCPDLIFVSPRFDRYKEISNKIQSILRSIRIWSSFH
jgi:DNA polymerase-4